MKRLHKYLLVTLAMCFSLSAQSAVITVVANLDYAQEVAPSNPVPSDAFGTATLMFDTTALTLDINAEITGISVADVTFPSGGLMFGMAGPFHIHNAPAGANGGVVVPFSLESYFTDTATGMIISAMGIGFDSGLIAELEMGNLYLNLHSLDYGSGEIRGQLSVVSAPATIALSLFVCAAMLLRSRAK